MRDPLLYGWIEYQRREARPGSAALLGLLTVAIGGAPTPLGLLPRATRRKALRRQS